MLDARTYRRFLKSTRNFHVLPTSAIDSQCCEGLAASLPHDYAFHLVAQDHGDLRGHLEASLRAVDGAPACLPMLDEIIALTQGLAMASGVAMPFVSLRVVTRAYCLRERPSVSRYYHRDAAAITVTKAYFGEGCTYVPNENVRRDYFETHSIQQVGVPDRDVLRDPERVHVVAEGAALLLKGEVYPGIDERSRTFLDAIAPGASVRTFNRGNGLIHKGGGFAMGSRRLVFTASVADPGPSQADVGQR